MQRFSRMKFHRNSAKIDLPGIFRKSLSDKFIEFLKTLLTIIERTKEMRLAPKFEVTIGVTKRFVLFL